MSKADAFTQAGKTAVLQNIHGTLQFLQRFPPFNQMENAHLAFLVEQCQLRFYGPGESILKRAGRWNTFTSSSRDAWSASGRSQQKPPLKSPPVNVSRWRRCWVSGRPVPS